MFSLSSLLERIGLMHVAEIILPTYRRRQRMQCEQTRQTEKRNQQNLCTEAARQATPSGRHDILQEQEGTNKEEVQIEEKGELCEGCKHGDCNL